MDNLNGEIKDIFTTFRTDLSGIRVRKLLKLVRTVQAHIGDLNENHVTEVSVFENGHSILVSRNNDLWNLTIDQATIRLDAQHVYDENGQQAICKELVPSVINCILNAA